MNREDCILFSGAAKGAESAFGEAAERHGIEEVNFTFEGHEDARTRGIRVLTHLELRQGDVSLAYVSRLMNRTFPDTPRTRWTMRSARTLTCCGDSPPGQPSRKSSQPGRSARISAVRRPSYAP